MTCKLAKKPIGQNLAVFSYYTNERVKKERKLYVRRNWVAIIPELVCW